MRADDALDLYGCQHIAPLSGAAFAEKPFRLLRLFLKSLVRLFIADGLERCALHRQRKLFRRGVEPQMPRQCGEQRKRIGLLGHSSGIQNVTIIASSTPAPGACLSGCPLGISSSENLFVFNADGQVGLGYAFSKDTKLSVNYRYEGYWNALRGFNAAGSAVNLDRTYSGPTVKLTVAY
jgi:hypothetical protein